ncbi:MAG: DUF6033 family protein [Lachnospiraceae bacterium]|nr:DUF6033 family protein [Lachnospiraceae bacterium]
MDVNNNIMSNMSIINRLNKAAKPASRGDAGKLPKWMESAKKGADANKVETNQGTGLSRTNESNLSEKAQNYLNSLREKYEGYDFFVGNEGDDLTEIAGAGTKEFSIIFSNEELEKMAEDEEYAAGKLASMENAVQMTSGLLEEAEDGDKIELGDGVSINRVTIAFKEDGSMQIFAEAEKSLERQRERIEKQRGEQADGQDKPADAEGASGQTGTIKPNPYEQDPSVKKVMVEAATMDELLTKIKDINWNEVEEEDLAAGARFNFSI